MQVRGSTLVFKSKTKIQNRGTSGPTERTNALQNDFKSGVDGLLLEQLEINFHTTPHIFK